MAAIQIYKRLAWDFPRKTQADCRVVLANSDFSLLIQENYLSVRSHRRGFEWPRFIAAVRLALIACEEAVGPAAIQTLFFRQIVSLDADCNALFGSKPPIGEIISKLLELHSGGDGKLVTAHVMNSRDDPNPGELQAEVSCLLTDPDPFHMDELPSWLEHEHANLERFLSWFHETAESYPKRNVFRYGPPVSGSTA